MALARHLVRAGVRRLALVGRTALSRDADPDSRAGRSLRDVAELEAGGAEVLLLTADVGVPAELRAALERCRDHYGTLTGVVHAAGLPAGGMAARRTLADAGAVLAPKVLAMGPLAELVGPDTPADRRPELLVLYSSAVTAFGGIGESDYCAANTVLDAYGEALAASAPSTRVVSIAWGPWRHDDWQAESLKSATGLAERVRAYRERYGFADDAGCALLDRIVAGGHGSVLAVRQPLGEVLRDWSAMVDIDALVGATTAVSLSERFPRPELRTDYAAPGPRRRSPSPKCGAPTSASTGSASTTRSSTSAATPWSGWPWCSPSRRNSACRSRPPCCSNTRPWRSSPRRWPETPRKAPARLWTPARRGGRGVAAPARGRGNEDTRHES